MESLRSPPNPEVVAGAKRRRFTMEYKLRILKQADAAKEASGGVGALLRREGLYSSHLTIWRQERDAAVRQALPPKTRGRKPQLDPQQEEEVRRSRLPPQFARHAQYTAGPGGPLVEIRSTRSARVPAPLNQDPSVTRKWRSQRVTMTYLPLFLMT